MVVRQMSGQSNILVLTSSFGMGHDSVANAIREQLMEENKYLNVIVKDILEISTPKTKEYFFDLYYLLTKKHPNIYNVIYNIKKDTQDNFIDEAIYNLFLKKVAEYIQEVDPQIIISTFPLCSGFVSRAKEKYNLNIPLITTITDVVDSWEWIHNNTDLYFVPCKIIEDKLVSKGIEKDRIKITGIPVKKDFLTPKEEKDGQYRQLLIMGGAMDKVKITSELLEKFDKMDNIKTVVITGNNKALYDELSAVGSYKNVEILGYTTEIAKLMDDADIIVTKPGGATLFEAINKGVPMVLKRSMVGQEEENIKFIKDTGIGILMDKDDSLDDVIQKSLNDLENLDQIKRNIEEIKTEMEPHKIGRYILDLL